MKTKITIFLSTLFCAFSGNLFAQNTITPIELAYSATFRGTTTAIGNTSMHIIRNGNVATSRMNEIGNANNGQGGIGYTQYGNDGSDMQFADIDSDASTFNSTSADLSFPSGTNTIKFARLYWGGRINNSAITSSADTLRRVKIKKDNGSYQTVTALAANVATYDVTSSEKTYQSYADITSIIQAGLGGTYTVANIPATPGNVTGGGKYAGWTLMIAYENPTLPTNSIRIYHGLYQISNGNSFSVTLDNLNVPNNTLSAGDALMTVMAWEGDGNLGATSSNPAGDYIEINGNKVSDGVNVVTNFWNGSISKNGNYVTTKNPNYYNQMGIDLDQINVGSGYGIQPNATQLTVKFGTEADQYFPSVFAFSIRSKDPLADITLTVADQNGDGYASSGEILTYTVKVKNNGPGGSFNSIVKDTLPSNVIYVPGSLQTLTSPGYTGVLPFDISGNTLVSTTLDGTNRTILTNFLGENCNINTKTGGLLNVGDEYTYSYKVTVKPNPGTITNTSNLGYTNSINDPYYGSATALISQVLPVRLTTFTGRLVNDNTSHLEWITSSEINSDYFEIQRSTDGINFMSVGRVAANGTTQLQHNYDFTDNVKIMPQVFYYRLRVVDHDLRETFSNIIPMRKSGILEASMTVYPNPFADNVKLFIRATKSSKATIKIFSVDGKTVSGSDKELITGDNVIVLDNLSRLPKGAYYVEVRSGEFRATQKIMKQ